MNHVPKKLSIGFLYDDSLDKADGVSHQVKTLGRWLSEQGHDVCYIVGQSKTRSWAGGKVYSLSRNINVSFNGNRLSTPLPSSSKKIKKALNEIQPDVIHVQMPYSPFMAQRVINRASRGTAIVGTFHILPANFFVAWCTKLLRLVYGKSLARFSTISAVSSPAAKFANRSLKVSPIVVPNAIEIERLHGHSGKNERLHVVFLGRLVKRKGCYELLQAFVLLRHLVPGVRLSIAGEGPDRHRLERSVREHSLQESVTFLGFIGEADKPGLLARADIACFPSLYGESFGIVLIEAMAAGAGVVMGGDNPGYRAVLGEYPKTLVNPRNVPKFAKTLETLLTDAQLSQEIHNWQQDRVKRYDINVVGEQVLKMYREAIASRRQKT